MSNSGAMATIVFCLFMMGLIGLIGASELNVVSPVSLGEYGNESRYDSSKYIQPLPRSDSSVVENLYVNSLMGALTAIMISCVGLVILISVKVLSTGLDAYANRIIVTTTLFSLLWVVVTSAGVALLVSIPFYGWLIYGCFSFGYYLGVWGLIHSGGT